MRETVELKNIGAFFAFIQAAVFWWVLPALMLPFGVEWASLGPRRTEYRRVARVQGSLRYWIWMVIPAVIAAWVPKLLINWKPGKGLGVEMTSAILRLGIAYGIALACWLFAIALAACSMKNQQSTVSSAAEDIGGNPTVQPA
jgi:hypothetical protein